MGCPAPTTGRREPGQCPALQPVALPIPQRHRAFLQQAQTLQGHRCPLRTACRQPRCTRQAGRFPNRDISTRGKKQCHPARRVFQGALTTEVVPPEFTRYEKPQLTGTNCCTYWLKNMNTSATPVLGTYTTSYGANRTSASGLSAWMTEAYSVRKNWGTSFGPRRIMKTAWASPPGFAPPARAIACDSVNAGPTLINSPGLLTSPPT